MRDEESLSDDENAFPDDKLLVKTEIVEEPQEVSSAPFPFAVIQAATGIAASIVFVVLVSIVITGHNVWPSKSGCKLSCYRTHLLQYPDRMKLIVSNTRPQASTSSGMANTIA
jgi:hypothetical protein